MKKGYYDGYVRPSAWEPVLSRFPKLKFYLAHFDGGSSDWADWSHDTRVRMEPRIKY